MNTPCRVKPDESTPVIGIMPALEVERIIKSKDAELAALRADLATVTAECDVMALALQGETKLIKRLTELTIERDKFADMFNAECLKVTQLREQLATYERMKAVRQ